MARFLITGGAGFVGSHLAAALHARGDEVHILVRPSTNLYRLRGGDDGIAVHRCDLGDLVDVKAVLSRARPEVIYHLAAATRSTENGTAFDDAHVALSDVSNCLNLLMAAESSACSPTIFVRTGTLAEYGNVPHPYLETEREEPKSPYAVGMVSATRFADALAPNLSFPVISARLGLTYGAGQSRKFLLPALVETCRKRGTMHVRYPEERRDLISVDDVVEALILLAERPPPQTNLTMNISTGIAPTMRSVAEMIVGLTGAPPSTVTFGAGISEHGVHTFMGSPVLMEQLYGWTAKVGFSAGLRRYVEEFEDQGESKPFEASA